MPSAVSAVLLVTLAIPIVLALNLRTDGPEELQHAVRQLEQRHDRQLDWGRGNDTTDREDRGNNTAGMEGRGNNTAGMEGRGNNTMGMEGRGNNTTGMEGRGNNTTGMEGSDDDDMVPDEAYTHIGCFQIDEDVVAGYGASNFTYSSRMTTDVRALPILPAELPKIPGHEGAAFACSGFGHFLLRSRCYKKCARRGTTFMALANGFICWCGFGEEDSYTQGGVGMCGTACWGNEDMMCGGEEAFDLYRVEEEMMPPPSSMNVTYTSMTSVTVDTDTSASSDTTTGGMEPSPTPGPVMLTTMSSPTRSETVSTTTTSSSYTTPAVTPVTPTPLAVIPSSNDDLLTSGSAPADMEMLLELHNLARCEHNAEPLTWSDTVADSAANYADVLAGACGSLVHSDSSYGENLYLCYGSMTCYTPERAMEGLYVEEINASSVGGYGGHATQILWKSTKELGCALGYCGDRTYLVCQYSPPGNYVGMIEENVEVDSGNGCYP